MALVALMGAGISCGGGTEPPSSSSTPPPSGSPVLVFTSERDGDPEIYVVDDAGQRRVTNHPGADDNPAWSPDGSRIVFERESALWSMRADGSDVLQLTTPPTGAHDIRQNGIPLPSSDGRVLYGRYSAAPTTVRIVNVDGSNDHELAAGSVPSWSADGSLVAFNVFSGGKSDTYLIRADGSQSRNLTNTQADDEDWPVLSPDGQQVAFTSSNDGITIMKTDGTGRTPLVRAGNVYQWSPDGRQIAYRSPRAGTASFFDVWVVNADGSGKRRLTDENFFVNAIRWAPDGSRIAIDNGRPPNTHIYVMNADGSDFRRVTPLTSPDYQPDWKR